MARPAAVATWEAVIAAFEGMSTGFVFTDDGFIPMLEVSEAALHSTEAAKQRVQALPELSAKTWARLIKKKVPYRLAAACNKQLSRLATGLRSNVSSSSSSSSSMPSSAATLTLRPSNAPGTVAFTHRLRLLCVFKHLLRAAERNDIILQDPVDRLQAEPGPQAAAIRKQVQQSGLLQVLPQVLGSMADAWEHVLAGGTASCCSSTTSGCASDTISQSGLSTQAGREALTSSSSSTYQAVSLHDPADSRCGSHTDSDETLQPSDILQREAHAAFGVLSLLRLCWPDNSFLEDVLPGARAPLCRLAGLVFQHVSQVLSSPSDMPSKDQLDQLGDAWIVAGNAAAGVLQTEAEILEDHHAESPEAVEQQLLESASSYFPSFGVLLTASVYASLLLQLPNLPVRAGSVSASTNQVSKSRILSWANRATAWQYACDHYKQLPASHQQLLQSVGCDSRTVLWSAAMWAAYYVDKDISGSGEQDSWVNAAQTMLTNLLCLYTDILKCPSTFLSQQQQQQQQQPSMSTDLLCREQQIHLLLSTVLLYWVAHRPASIGSELPAACAGALFGSYLAAERVSKQTFAAPYIVLPEGLMMAVLQDVLPQTAVLARRWMVQLNSTNTIVQSDSSSAGSSGCNATANSARCAVASSSNLVRSAWSLLWMSSLVTAVSEVCSSSTTQAESQQPDKPQSAAHCSSIPSTQAAGNSNISTAAAWAPHALLISQLQQAVLRHPKREVHMLNATLTLLCFRVNWTDGEGNTFKRQAPLLAAALSDGPGSFEQRQLFCVMISTLKVLRLAQLQVGVQHSATIRVSAADEEFDPNQCFAAVLGVTNDMLTAPATAHAPQVPGWDPTTALPWLVLAGRCCLHPAAVISGAAGAGAAEDAAAGQFLCGQDAAAPEVEPQVQVVPAADRRLLGSMIKLLHAWLLGPNSPLVQLDAAGYKASGLLQPLQTASQCLDSLTQCPDDEVSAGVAKQLQGLGLALSNLAVRVCCNNPQCTNLSGPSELRLVNGHASACGGCRVARYCSRACLKQHWKQHKPVCQSLAAAKAAAARLSLEG